jgi:xanthine dehydrogenase accessory factor
MTDMTMMSHSLLELEYRLTQAGKSFVRATVVWCERPTSAKPGAQAIIDADGQMTGWIGGSCTQPIVIREALRSLREGDEPYLLRLGTSDTAMIRPDVRSFPMTCSSGGVLDIYMEPHFPPPQLLLIGNSPITHALSQLALVLNFAVTQCNAEELHQVSIDQRTLIVVATHGEYDEEVLTSVLRSPALYIGMVASRRRADACRTVLRASGLEEEHIARLKAPAGLDVGAVTPEEIAASILLELVQVRRRPGKVAQPGASVAQEAPHAARPIVAADQQREARDPVCGMMVEIAGARHHSTYDGREFYFCCPACKRLFERNPKEYLVENER